MKRIISLTLAALMLALLLLTATSCGMESITGYTRLRDHIIDKVGYDKILDLNQYATIKVTALDGGDSEIHASIGGMTTSYVPIRVTLKLNGSVEKAQLVCEELDGETGNAISTAYADVLLTHYTGNDNIEFTSTENLTIFTEYTYREYATILLNSLLQALDTYTTENLDMDVTELGFIALSDKYMANVETVETEEDLGGAFSSARLQMAGRILLQGIGMVFLVLAILWLVLLIFKAVFYKDPAKKSAEKPAPAKQEAPAKQAAPAPTPVAAAPAPATDDGQLIAVITAAVAAAIESDPALNSQFASGFRVVSFKKTETTTRNR